VKGSIRFLLGLVIVAGAVGTLDADPYASLLTQATVAAAGIALLAWGVLASRKQHNG
jgi:formate hydrogenlyase subunit 3/multisubunit Na+/H+ antiporter MnhD subunit